MAETTVDAADSQEVKTAKEMGRIAAADDWFQKRRSYPNADLYGQFLYVALQALAPYDLALRWSCP